MSITEGGRRILVTGTSGFTGRYVVKALAAAGNQIIELPARLDITDLISLKAALGTLAFDDVIHLAAISFVGHKDAADFYRVNTVGTTALLEAISATRPVGRVVLASSANVYGNCPISPTKEDAPFSPVNHYAASKVAMEMMVQPWTQRLPIVVTRPFNYTGKGQQDSFLIPKIVSHFVQRREVLELGNLDVVRDFSDVRDVAAAYVQLLDAPAGTTVNICCGIGTALRDVVEHCVQVTGHHPEIRINPAFVRKDEIRELIGSTAQLDAITDASSRRPFLDTLDWMLAP